jgi:N-acetylneuraminic acid mutarotase
MKKLLVLFGISVLLSTTGCFDGASPNLGTENHPCDNGSCNSGLKCIEAYCINPWSMGASMPQPVNSHTASVVTGKIYVIGGITSYYSPLDTVYIYNTLTENWSTGANIPTAISDHTSSVVDGKIYVIGGYMDNYLDTVYIYNTSTDSWSTGSNMPQPRYYHSSSVVDGKIYVIGGIMENSLDTVYCYDPLTDSWSTQTSLPEPIAYHSSSVVDDKIYVIGGGYDYNSELDTVYIYDTLTDNWSLGSNIPQQIAGHTSSVVYGKIYTIGGLTTGNTIEDTLDSVYIYNPETNTWSTGASLPQSIGSHSSSVVNGKIYIIGGGTKMDDVYNTQLDTVYIHNYP